MASFFTMPSSAAYIFFFSSTFSMTASMTMSQSARSCMLVVPFRRARTACGVSLSVPFSANFGQRLLDAGETLVEILLLDFENGDVESGRGRDLRDARAHQSATENANFLDFHDLSFFTTEDTEITETFFAPCLSASVVKNLVHALHHHRNSLPAADAGRRQAVLLLSAAEFVQQRNHQPRAGRAQRMSQSDRAAVDVYFFAIEARVLFRPRDTARRRPRSLR